MSPVSLLFTVERVWPLSCCGAKFLSVKSYREHFACLRGIALVVEVVRCHVFRLSVTFQCTNNYRVSRFCD